MVAPQLHQQPKTPAAVAVAQLEPIATLHADPTPRPFRMGLPALDAFPRKLWARLVASEARASAGSALGYPDPLGEPGLRQAIAAYLAISRGISCGPDQVFVTAGYQGALSLIARTLIDPGTPVWVEDPGYHMAAHNLAEAGARLVPVPVDADGMRVEAAIAGAAARFAVVTPSHQSPLGVSLSLPRRLVLLAWAEQNAAWIIEDDYDGEFHYAGRPLPALKSLDQSDVVLYVGSFSKVLFPGLRLGYLVVPDSLMRPIARAGQLLQAGQSCLEQRVVASFMAEGHFARHLRRMRSLYATRRAALADALGAVFGDRIRLELQAGGMHLIARFPDGPDDVELVRRAVKHDLALTALSSLATEYTCGGGLLLSFTNIRATEASAVAARLAAAIG
jgi:GntR family transcriptional regulator/MocR family aminotransferase